MLSKTLKIISSAALPKIIVIGLDVHATHISAVAKASLYGRSTNIASGVFDLPEGTIVEGELKNPAAFKDAIDAFLRSLPEGKIGASNEPVFILSVPPNHIYTETALFPNLGDASLDDSVRLKIETSLPWPLADSYVDWNSVLEQGDSTGVFIAAASKKVLDKYFQVFLENDWKLAACEFHLFTLGRVMRERETNPFIFILFTEDGVEFAAYANGGIISHYFEPASRTPDSAVIEAKVRQIASYVESNYGIKIEKVVVFDKAGMERTSANVSSITGIPAQAFAFNESGAGIDPRTFIAYAASERPYSSGETVLNLMPSALGGRYQENLFSKTVALWVKIATIVIGIFLVAIGGLYGVFSWEEAGIHSAIQSFKPALLIQEQNAAPLITDAAAFDHLVTAASEAKQFRTKYGDLLEAVQKAMTANGVSFVQARADSAGTIAVTFDAPTRSNALDFQAAMREDKTFSDIVIPLDQLAPDSNLRITALITKA